MFGRTKTPPQAELRCSFCNKDQNDVRKLIAGPMVFICDQCVGICIDILADDRRASGEEKAEAAQRREAIGLAGPPPEDWPASDAWCRFCGQVTDLQSALMIENRTLLCGSCVNGIAAAATEAARDRGE